MKITEDYLKTLNYDELLELYKRYDRMGQNVLRFDIEIGLAILDDAEKMEDEIIRRKIDLSNNKKKLKKLC